MKVPDTIRYPTSQYQFVMGTQSHTDLPTYRNIITRWYLDDGVALPEGLKLDEKTGQINGIPTDTSDGVTFTVYGENESGAASATVSIRIRKGQCAADGVFPTTDAGVVATYDCSMKGHFIGTQKRECVLGATDGE